MEVVIIDYNAGNIRSVENALKRLSVEPVITADKQLIRHADKVIFPGVGEAQKFDSACIGNLSRYATDEPLFRGRSYKLLRYF